MKRFALCVVFILEAPALLRAQDAPKPVKLTVSAAAEPEPALKYALLPPLAERKSGNAALLYYRAGILARSDRPETEKSIFDWQVVPLDALPRDQVRELLQSRRGALDELGLAARRKRCDWLLPLQEQGASALLLPELQELRNLGRLLALQIRLQIAEGRTREALESLQVGFALARHTSEGATLIHGLIGVAVTGMMFAEVEELIRQPGTPNLYWALTALPQPLVDLHAAMETEREFLFLDLPMLRGAERLALSRAQEQKLREGIMRLLSAADRDVDLDALVNKAYPAAKEKLIQRGAAPEVVVKMSALQVVAVDAAHTYEHLRDGLFKWYYVPLPNVKEHLEEAQRAAVETAKDRLPFAEILLPAVTQVHVAGTLRRQRDVAALRCIEAIRMYAATHDGKLPEKLADITQVPVPEDPYTGQEFSYLVQDEVARLESAGPEAFGLGPGYGKRYEITIRR